MSINRNLTIDAYSSLDLSYSLTCARVIPQMPPTTPPDVIDFLTRATRIVQITRTQWETVTKRLYCSLLHTVREYEEMGYTASEIDEIRFIYRLRRDANRCNMTPLEVFRRRFVSLVRKQGSCTIEDDISCDSVVVVVEDTDIVLKGGADND